MFSRWKLSKKCAVCAKSILKGSMCTHCRARDYYLRKKQKRALDKSVGSESTSNSLLADSPQACRSAGPSPPLTPFSASSPCFDAAGDGTADAGAVAGDGSASASAPPALALEQAPSFSFQTAQQSPTRAPPAPFHAASLRPASSALAPEDGTSAVAAVFTPWQRVDSSHRNDASWFSGAGPWTHQGALGADRLGTGTPRLHPLECVAALPAPTSNPQHAGLERCAALPVVTKVQPSVLKRLIAFLEDTALLVSARLPPLTPLLQELPRPVPAPSSLMSLLAHTHADYFPVSELGRRFACCRHRCCCHTGVFPSTTLVNAHPITPHSHPPPFSHPNPLSFPYRPGQGYQSLVTSLTGLPRPPLPAPAPAPLPAPAYGLQICEIESREKLLEENQALKRKLEESCSRQQQLETQMEGLKADIASLQNQRRKRQKKR